MHYMTDAPIIPRIRISIAGGISSTENCPHCKVRNIAKAVTAKGGKFTQTRQCCGEMACIARARSAVRCGVREDLERACQTV